jgi:hypothetical protein
VGEPARDGETLDSQDRPVVNPAGAGRKIESLSREICVPVRLRRSTRAVMCGDGDAEVSRGHSTLMQKGKGRTRRARQQVDVRGCEAAENPAIGLRLRR